jgi:hypothetical protein
MRGFDRDLIRGGHYGQRPCEPHQQAEHIYGQPRLRKGQLMPTGRLPAVIYPVSIDPDGFRGTTPNHLTLSKTSDVFVGLGHPSVRNRSAITSIAFAAR